METSACKDLNAYLKDISDFLQAIVRQKQNYLEVMNEMKLRFTEAQINFLYSQFKKEVYGNLDLYEDNSLIRSYIFNYLNNCIESPITDVYKHQLIALDVELPFLVAIHRKYCEVKNNIIMLIKPDSRYGNYKELDRERLVLKQLKQKGEFPFKEEDELVDTVTNFSPKTEEKNTNALERKDQKRVAAKSTVVSKAPKLVEKLVWTASVVEFKAFFEPILLNQSISLNNEFEANKLIDYLMELIFIPEVTQNRFRPSVLPDKKKLHWHDTPQKFVPLFFPLIQNKKFTYRSESDSAPIVHELANIFNIEAKRKEGFISSDTLNSYFKKYKAGVSF